MVLMCENMEVLLVKTPITFIEDRLSVMQDLTLVKAARPIFNTTGETLRVVGEEHIGHAEKVWADQHNFGLSGCVGDPDRLEKHVAE
jgi:hypothetical protein